MPAPIVPEPDDADFHAGDPTEDRGTPARRVGVKFPLVAALLLLLVVAACGALAEAAQGRRPALARRRRGY